MIKFIRNQSGVGILQALIGAGMLGGIAYAFATMQKNAAQAQALNRFQSARNEMRMDIVSYMQRQTSSCTCSMKSEKFNPGSLPATMDVGSPGFQIMADTSTCTNPIRTVMNTGMINENAKVTSMQVTIFSGAGNTWTGELKVDLQPTTQVAGFANRAIVIPVDFGTIDSGGMKQIDSCVKTESGGAGSITFNPSEIGDTTNPPDGSKTWTLTKVPPEAKAIHVKWLIGKVGGSGKSDREDRKCTVTSNTGASYRLGYQSYGDGEAHWIGGTSIFRLGNPPHQLSLSCSNEGGQGYFTVDGVIY